MTAAQHPISPTGSVRSAPANAAYPQIDTSVAHPARRYNFWLGGKDNFASDRESGTLIAKRFPTVVGAARANRAFLGRSVRCLAEFGIRQFLDIGTGLPAANNTHEVAQQVAPDSRVVYVDNDPIVLVHARALLTGTVPGTVAYLERDLHDPAAILADPDLHATLDLTKPIGLLLVAVLHFIADAADPDRIVADLVRALAPGSYLVLSHGTDDFMDPDAKAALPGLTAGDAAGFYPRSHERITAFLEGLELVEPGLVSVADWHNTADEDRLTPDQTGVYGAVARIP